MNNNRKKKTQTQTPGEERLKSFLDMIAPSVIQFYTDHYICGNTFRSVTPSFSPRWRRIACSSVAVGYSLSAQTLRNVFPQI